MDINFFASKDEVRAIIRALLTAIHYEGENFSPDEGMLEIVNQIVDDLGIYNLSTNELAMLKFARSQALRNEAETIVRLNAKPD